MTLNLILFGTQLFVCGTFPHNDMLAAHFPIVRFPSHSDEKKKSQLHISLIEQKNTCRKHTIVGENVSGVKRVKARFNFKR